MDHASLLPTFADFGPSLFSPQPTPPLIHRADGSGTRRLLKQLKLTCPTSPGVYAMLNRDGQILYIGKAKRLRVRLLSYFRPRSRPPKAGRIVRQTSTIVWEKWPHEFSASLRELELIRRWRPNFNVQGQPLRRQLTYLCLGGWPVPYFFLSRKPPVKCSAIEGPVSLQSRTRDAVQLLNNAFRLRDCPQKQRFSFSDDKNLFPAEQTPGCLRYEIGNCLGPCAALCSRKDYQRETSAAYAFLLGNCDGPIDHLRRRMCEASQEQQYELAHALQTKVVVLEWLVGQLAAVRKARSGKSFVYPIPDAKGNVIWHLIHGSRTVCAIAKPSNNEEKEETLKRLQSIYAQQTDANFMQSYEHLDGMTLVRSWFQQFPDEQKRTLSPSEAMKYCGE